MGQSPQLLDFGSSSVLIWSRAADLKVEQDVVSVPSTRNEEMPSSKRSHGWLENGPFEDVFPIEKWRDFAARHVTMMIIMMHPAEAP